MHLPHLEIADEDGRKKRTPETGEKFDAETAGIQASVKEEPIVTEALEKGTPTTADISAKEPLLSGVAEKITAETVVAETTAAERVQVNSPEQPSERREQRGPLRYRRRGQMPDFKKAFDYVRGASSRIARNAWGASSNIARNVWRNARSFESPVRTNNRPKTTGALEGTAGTIGANVAGKYGYQLLDWIAALPSYNPLTALGGYVLPAVAPVALHFQQKWAAARNGKEERDSFVRAYPGIGVELEKLCDEAHSKNLLDTAEEKGFLENLRNLDVHHQLMPQNVPPMEDVGEYARYCYHVMKDIPLVPPLSDDKLRDIAAEYAITMQDEHETRKSNAFTSSVYSSAGTVIFFAAAIGGPAAAIPAAVTSVPIVAYDLVRRYRRKNNRIEPDILLTGKDSKLEISSAARIRTDKGALYDETLFKTAQKPLTHSAIEHYASLMGEVPPDFLKKDSDITDASDLAARWHTVILRNLVGRRSYPHGDEKGLTKLQQKKTEEKEKLAKLESEKKELVRNQNDLKKEKRKLQSDKANLATQRTHLLTLRDQDKNCDDSILENSTQLQHDDILRTELTKKLDEAKKAAELAKKWGTTGGGDIPSIEAQISALMTSSEKLNLQSEIANSRAEKTRNATELVRVQQEVTQLQNSNLSFQITEADNDITEVSDKIVALTPKIAQAQKDLADAADEVDRAEEEARGVVLTEEIILRPSNPREDAIVKDTRQAFAWRLSEAWKQIDDERNKKPLKAFWNDIYSQGKVVGGLSAVTVAVSGLSTAVLSQVANAVIGTHISASVAGIVGAVGIPALAAAVGAALYGRNLPGMMMGKLAAILNDAVKKK